MSEGAATEREPGLAVTLVELYRLLRLTVRGSLEGGLERGAVLRQMYEIGNRSLLFLCIVMAFMGMILTYQAGIQTQRVVPDLSLLGATFFKLLVRDLAASICALMLATRVGAGIAAEIGSMVVTEQVDALRMCGADPIKYLVCPRFLASLIMLVLLVVVAATMAIITGSWTAATFFHMNPRTFLNFALLSSSDAAIGFAKCIAYGGAIPIISAHAGLSAFGGSEGVGSATTRAVVGSSLAVVVLNFLISSAGYVLLGP